MLTVTKTGTGAGTVTSTPAGISCGAICSASYGSGTSVMLTAAASTGSTFAGWSGGGCTGTGACTVSVTAATTVTATFTAIQYVVSVAKTGTGTGTVTSGTGGINCGATCMASFNAGASVSLTATPAAGSVFAGWSGGGCAGTAPCTFTVNAAVSVTAAFNPAPLLYYALEGGGTNTGSVAGYPLVFNGTVSTVAGKVGSAAQYSSGAYGTVQGSARAVLAVYPQYTISLWVNSSSPNTSNSFLDFNNRTTAPYGGLQLSYLSATQFSMCVATTTNSFLTGSCPVFAAPAGGAWHNVIIRYAGTGTAAGQGAGVQVYEDDVLTTTVANDSANNPVFGAGMPDTLSIGVGPGIALDEVKIYNVAFSVADQCTVVIGGTWTGTACTLP